MNDEKDILKQAAQVDFDPCNRAKNRVWARLQSSPSSHRSWARPLAWGTCAAFLLAAGSWLGVRWSAYLHCPAEAPAQPAFSLQNAQCKNADGHFLISTQLECNGTNCSCTKTLTICNEHPVTHVTHKTCTQPSPDFDPKDPWKLWENPSPKQIQDLASCQNQC